MSPVHSTPSPGAPSTRRFRRVAADVLVAWFTLIVVLAAAGAFSQPPGTPPLPIGIAFVAPIALFGFGVVMWPALREFALALDLRVAAAIQAWRFAGLAFVALYVHQVLPGSFAWPAGLGDIAIGMTAPWMVAALSRDPRFAASRTFRAWNWLGIADLFVAVGSGALNAALATGAPGETSTLAMSGLPLVLIPAYFVPIFVMLHIAALMQARRAASAGGTGAR